MSDNKGELMMTGGSAVGSCISAFCIVSILLNLWVCYKIYRRRGSRSSSTAIIVANLACVDVLVTIKDLPMLINVSKAGTWYFEESWCSTYGLTNVIFIIVSVSSLVTITTERYVKIRETGAALEHRSKPLLLGYVIAHTTLSYSLSLLWSKYIFLARKAYCRVEWPPRQGFSFTFVTSFIFIIPVSFLIYNLLYRNVYVKEEIEAEEKLKELSADNKEYKAHCQLQLAVALFLVSWLPYVMESMVSGYIELPPIASVITAFFPMISTSFLPYIYMRFVKEDDAQGKNVQFLNVYVQ